jgi:hypothetical protein
MASSEMKSSLNVSIFLQLTRDPEAHQVAGLILR